MRALILAVGIALVIVCCITPEPYIDEARVETPLAVSTPTPVHRWNLTHERGSACYEAGGAVPWISVMSTARAGRLFWVWLYTRALPAPDAEPLDAALVIGWRLFDDPQPIPTSTCKLWVEPAIPPVFLMADEQITRRQVAPGVFVSRNRGARGSRLEIWLPENTVGRTFFIQIGVRVPGRGLKISPAWRVEIGT